MECKKCLKCGGNKVYFPLGGVPKDCEDCSSTGYILNEMEEETIREVENQSKTTNVVTRKKPGPKPRSK